MKKRIVLSALAAAVSVCACGPSPTSAKAAALSAPIGAFGAGLWRISVGDGEDADTVDVCLRRPSDLRTVFERSVDDAAACTNERSDIGRGKIAVAFSCTANGGTTRAVTDARYDAATLDGQTEITVQVNGVKAHSATARVHGRRVGDCVGEAGQ